MWINFNVENRSVIIHISEIMCELTLMRKTEVIIYIPDIMCGLTSMRKTEMVLFIH